MPIKTCPDCHKTYGVRQKTCPCGHDFGVKRTKQINSEAVEPGTWIKDLPRGMELQEPNIPTGGLTTAGVSECVAYEGLGFCIYTLIPARQIIDPRLRELWTEARQAMQKIVEHLV